MKQAAFLAITTYKPLLLFWPSQTKYLLCAAVDLGSTVVHREGT